MLSCSKCNASLPEGMRFCLQCGVPLAAAAPTGTTATSAIPLPSAPENSAAPPVPAPAAPEVSPAAQAAPAWLAEDLASAQAAPSPEPTITLKVAPSVVIAPRAEAPPDHTRPERRPEAAEVEEALRRAFERPPVQPGTVACRFCKGPLDVEGEYCEQCGAPVEEAAPPGVLRPKPQPAAPEVPVPATAPAPPREMGQPAPSVAPPALSFPSRPAVVPPGTSRYGAPPATPVRAAAPVTLSPVAASAPTRKIAQPAPPVASPIPSIPTRLPIAPSGTTRYGAPPLGSVLPGAKVEPMRKPLLKTRMPMPARPPKPKLAGPEPPPGLKGRLKGLLKTKKVNFPVRYP
jgi:hypothetical protein